MPTFPKLSRDVTIDTLMDLYENRGIVYICNDGYISEITREVELE